MFPINGSKSLKSSAMDIKVEIWFVMLDLWILLMELCIFMNRLNKSFTLFFLLDE
jgi:hypothetical protein